MAPPKDKLEDDPKDRKRRFLRGLNALLGYKSLEGKDILMREAITVSISEFRRRLANFYCLEFTPEELEELIERGTTTGDFTEKYVEVIYNYGEILI